MNLRKSLIRFVLLMLMSTVSVFADVETRLDWKKINQFVQSWPITEIANPIPSNLIAHWETSVISFRCPSITGSFDSFPTKYNPKSPNGGCNHLGAALFNSLLCASGSEEGCWAVRQSQRTDGEWFLS